MSRLPVIPLEQMTPEQRKLHDRIASGPRGAFRGPFTVWIRSPEYLDRLDPVGEYLRFKTVLPPRLSEFAILIAARLMKARYPFQAHEPLALKGGLAPAVIGALREGKRPPDMKADEAAVYGFATELLETKFVSDAAFKAVMDLFGERGALDLTVLLGHYAMVSMTVNAFEVPVPPGVEPPFPL
ncbi:MAG: carboxymuconolactone decarboxylase family protein [Candidatus Tectomicrobia bacterium]|uniref:Carboxymuconolactone decarboxylase family protein n=1 Tax=Tectimicrobiota bacterium TaxID=2528274 RepID=A0A932HZ30_UNCTE|nr:carboxymuconolactone decarboxylase family protein [Candidatus Tectomicrobia bacterium]